MTSTEIEDYLSRLRRELDDLPAAEVDEIIEDLEPQLVEIAAAGGAPADRLGTPAEYARELRAAAGFGTGRSPRWLPRTMFWLLVVSTGVAGICGLRSGQILSADAGLRMLLMFTIAVSAVPIALGRPATSEVAGLAEVRRLTSLLTRTENTRRAVAYLTTLQPAWFLIRAFLVWLGLVWVFRDLNWFDPWPEVVATACAVCTPVVGYRARDDRRWLWLGLPLTMWAVGVAVSVGMGDIWSAVIGSGH